MEDDKRYQFDIKLVIFICLYIFFICFILSVPSFASEHGGGGSSRGLGIYNVDSLNSKVIASWNSLSATEQATLIQQWFPVIMSKLGAHGSITDYDTMNLYYLRELEYYQGLYPTVEEFHNSVLSQNVLDLYSSSEDYYHSFAEFLMTHLIVEDDNIVVDTSITQPVYNFVDNYIESNYEDNGIIFQEILSYKNINSSNFPNLTAYNNFISLCEEHSNSGFVLCIRGSANSTYYGFGPISTPFIVAFPNSKPNLYNNGSTVSNTLNFLDNNGNTFSSFSTYYLNKSNNTFVLGSSGIRFSNLTVGISSMPSVTNYGSIASGVQQGTVYLFTTLEQKTNFQLFTSVSGWLNHQGHYETPFSFDSFWGSLPSTNVSSSNITAYYNYTYNTDNSVTGDIYNGNYNPNNSVINGDASTGSGTTGLTFNIGSATSQLGSLQSTYSNGFSQWFGTIFGFLPSGITIVLGLAIALSIGYFVLRLIRGF